MKGINMNFAGFVIGLIYLSFIVFLVHLAIRLVTAVEKIANHLSRVDISPKNNIEH